MITALILPSAGPPTILTRCSGASGERAIGARSDRPAALAGMAYEEMLAPGMKRWARRKVAVGMTLSLCRLRRLLLIAPLHIAPVLNAFPEVL